MKNIIKSFALVVAVTVSATAGATAITAPITTTDCALLSEQVTLNLSNNVLGSYNCDVANTEVKIAACHTSGSRKPTDVSCTVVGQDASGADVYNDSSCTGESGQKFTIANYRGYQASNKGGGVGVADLGGNCTAATVDALVQ